MSLCGGVCLGLAATGHGLMLIPSALWLLGAFALLLGDAK